MMTMQPDDDVWARDTVTGNRAWCSACGRMFGGPASFDQHRGIRQRPRLEDAQDAGRCAVGGLQYVDRIYWTPEELRVRTRLQAIKPGAQP